MCKMTDRELLQQALDALNNYVGVVKSKFVKSELNKHSWDTKIVDAGKPAMEAIEALRARLAQPEPYPENFIDVLRFDAAQSEPVIYARKEGDLIVADLPQVPRGSGGIIKDEQPEPEPVAWISHNAGLYHGKPDESLNPLPLYTAPPKKEWVGLTGEELQEIYQGGGTVHFKLAMAEEKLKEKNT
jgi:hypothetical protein